MNGGRRKLRAASFCLVLGAATAGRDVVTIEGFAPRFGDLRLGILSSLPAPTAQ